MHDQFHPLAELATAAGSADTPLTPRDPLPCAAFGERDPAELQQLYCAHRRACLDIAARAQWEAFTCDGCHGYQAMPVTQWRDETIGLAALGLALTRLIRAGGDPSIGRLHRRPNAGPAPQAPPCARPGELGDGPEATPKIEPVAGRKP